MVACTSENTTTETTEAPSESTPFDSNDTTDNTDTTTDTVETSDPTVTTEINPSEVMAANKYGAAALELTLAVCEQYYDMENHVLATTLENRNATTVWPLASFIEMLAEAYRNFPDNETVKAYYIDVLENCLPKHEVKNATIRPPSGKVYRKITYYNAGPNWTGDYYYDDNAWICIQLFDAYKLLGDEKYLK